MTQCVQTELSVPRNLAVAWFEGTGKYRRNSASFEMVTFGSSFNVCDRQAALRNGKNIKPGGLLVWNHRDLSDPIQTEIENIIKSKVSAYGYGTRREDQTAEINASGLFGPVTHLSAGVMHRQTIEECVEAWRSHATLERQAGKVFAEIISDIEKYLLSLGVDEIEIPYTTNIWISQLS